MKEKLEKFDMCLQHEVSFCSAACPFNLDVNTFISRLQEGRFNAAYKAYRDATGFPAIAAEICTEKCRGACLRNAVSSGDPVELLQLERACLAHSTRKDPVSYNVPAKNRSIAVIGGGISGMACAMRMATKKYRVTIFEASDRIGGHLLDTINSDIVDADFALQMQNLDYDIRFGHEVSSIEDVIEYGYDDNRAAAEKLKAQSAVASVMRSSTTNAAHAFDGTYDAIYVATGSKGSSFGFDISGSGGPDSEYGGPCAFYEGRSNGADSCDEIAVFLGGSLTGADSAQALADGLRISSAIDNYILTGTLRYPEYPGTDIAIDETRFVDTEAVSAGDKTYTKEEAVDEAKRCMKCQCNACRLHCDLTEYVHKWPLRLRDEIVATTAPGKSELHATPAVRLINSCTHCGLCRDTCPADIDMDGLIQAARVRMHQLDKMPWAFNDFFLRDMEFTLSEAAHVGRNRDFSAPDASDASTDVRYAFFPGCQFGAVSPKTVLETYRYLKNHEPSTGVILSCCGIPAMWAGDEDLHDRVIADVRSDWEALGKPVVILACPTCSNNFHMYLPEIETVYIYELMAEWGIADTPAGKGEVSEVPAELYAGASSVFDPCATKADDEVRQSVRILCRELGLKTEPLPLQEKWTACCSYGGHGAIADPQFTKFVRQNRVGESSDPFVTYCINCRDSFMQEGKTAPHILNIIFNIRPELQTWSKRRENRIWLKKQIMKTNNCESSIGDIPAPSSHEAFVEAHGIILELSDAVRKKLSDEYILEEEVAEAVAFCQRTGRTFHKIEEDTYTGYHKIGNLTYWVEYRLTGSLDTYQLVNAYTHRMTIDLEMVWNGKKVDIDV